MESLAPGPVAPSPSNSSTGGQETMTTEEDSEQRRRRQRRQSTPYALTKQERDMLDPNYKKPKRKRFVAGLTASGGGAGDGKGEGKRTPSAVAKRLHSEKTTSSKMKHRWGRGNNEHTYLAQ